MLYKREKAVLWGWTVFLILLAGCLGSANCFADDSDGAIQKFKKPPAFKSGEMDLRNLEDTMYKATGVVDAVNDKSVVIGDVMYHFEPGGRVHCRVGAFVGIKVNDRGNVIACEPFGSR